MIPTIGITTTLKTVEYYNYQVICTILPHFYVNAIIKGGGLPLLIPPASDVSVELYLDRVDGLLFSGGADIDPCFYDREKHEKTKTEDPARDSFEYELMDRALKRDLPILAICRGMQMLNVVMGGDLCQDIIALHDSKLTHWQELCDDAEPIHTVALRGGLVKDLFRKDQLPVNSFHHQSLDKIGRGLHVTGIAPDGIVEVVEAPDYTWVLGVQWHPELMYKSQQEQLILFEALVQKAKQINKNL